VQPTGQFLGFNNTNALVKSAEWDIQVSKTGFIREAGKCLVMMATIASRPVVIVLLDSLGRYTRVADAMRVKYWLETGQSMPIRTAGPAVKAVKAPAAKKATVKSSAPAKVAQNNRIPVKVKSRV
jgi:D-alanyl-D-alanine endopeptidase (penicillin-binding protein 7)